MRKGRRTSPVIAPAADAIDYLDSIARMLCQQGHTTPPDTDEIKRLIGENMPFRYLDWYRRSSENAEFEEALSNKMVDVRAFNPA